MNTNKYILVIVLCIAYTTVFAQETVSKLSVRADFYHLDNAVNLNVGALGVYDKVIIRPGIGLSAQYDWKKSEKKRLYSTLKLAFVNNTYEDRWGSIGTDLGFERIFWNRLVFGMNLGLHYNLAKAVDVRYVYENNKWIPAENDDPLLSRMQIKSGLELGYRIKDGARPMDVLITAGGSIVSPYLRDSSLSAWVYRTLGVGVRMGL